MIRVYGTESSKELGMAEIEVADKNMLPMVKVMVVDDMGTAVSPQPESLKEGGSVQIMAMVVDDKGKEMKAGEDLMVSLMPADGSTAGMRDYTTHPIPIDMGKSSSIAVTLMAEEDDIVEMETLMLDATASGDAKKGEATRSVMGVLSLMIEDATSELVWAKSEDDVKKVVYDAKTAGMGDDEMFNPGETITIMAGLLFNAAKGVTVTYTANSDKTDVASTTVGSDGTVTVMAKDMVGMANITITAHGSMPASGVKILDQDDPAEASIMFPVDVMLATLSLTLMGPEGDKMNIVEGGDRAMVKVMANRAVTETVEVKLMRERSMSDADDMDFELMPAMITIEAGKMEGSATVKAKADDMDEGMEELVLYAMAGDMAVEGHAKLYIWDAAVPALPVVAQFLLTAFLAVGGYRRFRRR